MPGDGINEDYLNDIAGLEPDDTQDDTSAREDSTREPTNGDAGTTDQQSTRKGEQVEDKSAKGAQAKQPKLKEDGAQQQPNKDDQGTKQLQKHVSGNFLDDKGNIVTSTGQIVAANGSHRRLYEDNARVRTRLADADRQILELRQQTEGTKLLNGIPAQFNLDQSEVAAALDLAGRMKRGDVLGVAKEVIALLAAQGHNVTELLGKDVGDSVDMKAIAAMMDRRLGPIQQKNDAEQERTRQIEVAQRNYNQFVSDNEYADVHGNEIAALAKQDGITLQQAYNRLAKFAADNQFDLSLPLGPQIEAKQAAAAGTIPNKGQQQKNKTDNGRPMPNGAGTRDGGVKEATTVYADPSDSWSSIIKRAQQADKQTVN